MRVLVAEDSEMVRTKIRLELESGGYEVLEAIDGIETLLIAAKESPDLITLDIEMPKLNGFETCRKLRGSHYSRFFKHKRNGRMPIIFITGNDTIEGRNEGFQLGAADFIVKPFAPGKVLSAVDNMLKPKGHLQGLAALVVDDSPVARHIISEALKREGVNVLEAEDGIQAFDTIGSRLSEIDIVITDMVMPRMNGLELCRKIRGDLNLAGLPVIFLTAASDHSQLIDVFNAGATDYLTKPFLKEELLARLGVQFEKLQLSKRHQIEDADLELLKKMRKNLSYTCDPPQSSLDGILKAARSLSEKAFEGKESMGELDQIQKSVKEIEDFILQVSTLSRPEAFEKINIANVQGEIKEPEEQSETPQPEESHGYRILLAESNPVNIKLVERIFQEAGHFVTSITDGPKALSAAENKKFDLIFMDTQLAALDGTQIAAAIRSFEKASDSHIPIIAIGDKDDDTEKERCIKAGMDDYVSRPVSPKTFLHVIEKQMLSSSAEDILPVDQTLEEDPENSPIMETEELMGRVGGEKDLFDEIIDLFLRDTPLQVKQLKEALEKKDGETVHRQGHTVKGSAANIGAHALKEAASEMEKAGKSDNWDLMHKIFKRLEREFGRLEDFLTSFHP